MSFPALSRERGHPDRRAKDFPARATAPPTEEAYPLLKLITPSLDPSGYDAGKKVKGRKRHILVDTLGLLLNVVVYPADVQDRDGAAIVLRQARRSFPFIERIYADGGYQGPKMAKMVAKTGAWRLHIVKRSDLHRFVVCPSAGPSNGPSLGSATAVDSPRTSNVMLAKLPPSSASP